MAMDPTTRQAIGIMTMIVAGVVFGLSAIIVSSMAILWAIEELGVTFALGIAGMLVSVFLYWVGLWVKEGQMPT